MKSVLFIFFSTAVVVSSYSLEQGEKIPGFANPDLKGTYVTSKNLVGKSWLLLDFFATDCEPCKKELPELETLGSDFPTEILRVVVFATDADGEKVVKPFFAARPGTATVLVDRYRVTADRFGVESIPTVFLVDPNGVVRLKSVGYKPEVLEEMRGLLSSGTSAGGGK